MAAELDPRLIGLLRASLDLVDALRDIGVAGEIGVRLDAEAGARISQLVDASDNRCNLAGLVFGWPKPVLERALAANDNIREMTRGGETPARR